MATSRRKRNYVDLDAVFAPNPVTGDIALRRDEQAVKFALKSLIMTKHYERPFQSSIGSQLNNFLFEFLDNNTIIVMKQAILNTIYNHEPRVTVDAINIRDERDNNFISVDIAFRIKNTDNPFNISIALERTR